MLSNVWPRLGAYMTARHITVLIATSIGLSLPAGAQAAVQIPALSGPYAVGTHRFEWVDSSRAEIAGLSRRDSSGTPRSLPAAGARRLTVQVWYPVTPAATSLPRAPYNPSGAAFSGVIRDTTRLQRYRAMTGRAALGGTPVSELFPLVVFSPGGSMFAADYTLLLEDLASHGYVVAAIAHPGTSLVAFADGSFGVESAWRPPSTISRSLELDSLRVSWAFFRARDAYMAADIHFAVRSLADAHRSPVAGIIDTSRIGFAGHSTGGSVATTAAMKYDVRHEAVIVYDVILPGVLFDGPLLTPLMLFRTTAANYPPGWAERLLSAFDGMRADGFDVLIEGGTHQGFSDRAVLAASDAGTRTAALRQFQATLAYSLAFLDHYLKGRSASEISDSARQVRYGVRLQRRR
jgi:predicted dienelactone hydrolase